MRSAAMNRPTVMPMAIWIMEAATLKTMVFRLFVVVCLRLALLVYSGSGIPTSDVAPPLMRAEAVCRADVILPLDAKLPGTCT